MRKMRTSVLFGILACVSLGLGAASDRQRPAFSAAKGVWAKGRAQEMNLSLRFESEVKLSGAEKSVVVRATGCSVYRLRVNGAFAGYGPARGPKGMDRVDEWDVTRFVSKGANAFEFDVAGCNVPNYYLPDQPSYLRAEIVADGRVLAATGTDAFRARLLNRVQKISRYSYQRPFCEAWNVSSPVIGAPLELEVRPAKPLLPRRAAYPTFAVHAAAKKVAESRARYDAQAKVRGYWALNAAPGNDPRGFSKEESEIIPVHEADRYVDDPNGTVRTTTFDFGFLDCGFAGARAKAHGKGRVLVCFAEVLTDGKVDLLRDGTANVVIWNIDRSSEFELETFEPYAFRYAKFIVDGDIEVVAPFIRTYKSPSADGVACPTEDPELRKIFEAARETFKQNAVDVFTDCPGRERAGWLCDSYFTARTSKYLTGSLDLEYLFLENYLYADCPDIPKAMFPMCYPADHINGNFIPNWAMWLVLELDEYLGRGGDPALVKRFEPKILALVDYLRTFENADGLLENLPKWVFVEWSECNNLTKGVNYPSNMTWARVLEVVAKLYGKPELAAKGAKVRETVVRQSFDGMWFRDQALRDKDGKLVPNPKHTETCQYYAFYFGTATEKTHPKLWKTLVEEFGPGRKVKNAHPDVPFSNAFIGNYLRLELLLKAGCKKAVEENVRGYFLKMAETTGTLWEHDSTKASCCHGFASYVALLVRDVLGVDGDPRTGAAACPPADATMEGTSLPQPTARGSVAMCERKVGRVAHGKPVVVDFGPQGEGGYPMAVVSAADPQPAANNPQPIRLRLSYATHPQGAGERGDFWHETRATYLGKDVLLPIPPANTDRFDVFDVAGPGVVHSAKAQGLVRYVRIAVDTPGATVDVDKIVLENREVHSTEPIVGSFSCPDEGLNRIWKASVRTCQLAAIPARGKETLAYLSDGAKRDRLVWSGDLWWAQRNMYAAFPANSPFMPGSIDMLAENQTPKGYINACPYPESRGPIADETHGPFGSDEFAAWFVPVFADHYLHSGDRDLLSRRYPNVVRLMGYLAAHQQPDGMFEQRAETAKHSEGLSVGGTSMHHRAYMHILLWRAYADAARLAAWAGKPSDAKRFTDGADKLAKLLRARFLRADEGRFILSLEQPDQPSFTADAAALAFGFLTGDEGRRTLQRLTRHEHGKFQAMAIRGALALRDGDKAMALLDAHNWRKVVADDWPGVHLTSECMGLMTNGWGDEAHPDTALAGVLTEDVLGVRPLTPGYETFTVDPIPVTGIESAKGRVPTARGFIDVEWTRKGGSLDIKVDSPSGITYVRRSDG